MTEFIIWLTAGVLLGIPVGLFFLFALTRPPRETVRTEYVRVVNGEIVDEERALTLAAQPMSDAEEASLAGAKEKAKTLFRREMK